MMKLNKIRLKNVEKLKITYSSKSNKLTDVETVDHIFNVCGKIYPKMLALLDHVAKKANTVVDYQE